MASRKRNMSGWLLAAAGLLCLMIFGVTLAAGIVNAGNLLGLLIGGAFISYGLFGKRLPRFFRRFFWGILGAGFLLILISGIMIVSQACRTASGEGTAVILGCGVRGETPSLMLRTRIEAAREYLESCPEARAICVGGIGPGESISEGACIRRELGGAGIEPQRLYVEERSTSTSENLLFAREIAEAEGLEEPWILISSEFHLYRAAHMARRLGVSVQTVPAKTPLWMLPTYFLRECLAVIKEWVLPDSMNLS